MQQSLSKIDNLKTQFKELCDEIDLAKKDALKIELENNKEVLKDKLLQTQLKIYEKQKLSNHTILIKVSEFESRLMMLMKLVRNSIMYLSLAIHLEEKISQILMD
ncbi:LA2681 family HEPN domain-containing protein [Acinetobacter pittii]|uniref:LA2681 family HEPN domain-containing protein n=1 Tax=Acinetobacter pittii TaxID=48296 RepID=UPI001F2FE652|nr:LA2681 family HEPN domain-containing protein [Acinetobacter pittii]MCF1283222.1 hypothetical protein [Acinetobacter pittii]